MEWYKFKDLKVELKDNQKEKLIIFKNLLQQENEKYNLTSITDDQEIIDKHFYDSLIFSNVFNLDNLEIMDIGTGAGFPGIVLKIIFPNSRIYLVESNGKKINFMNKVIQELNLKNIWTVNKRAEEFSVLNKEKFDLIISRAMAPLNILLEVGVQALKINGYFICLKGKNAEFEINDLNNCENKIGLKLEKIQEIDDLVLGKRINLFYIKIASTSNFYPRLYCQIKKRPLGK
ncbi:16S rRNA (guanine(527)-N(7))-methyltransferase RsmG [Spiroplasma taiwanense]|uniref:Ribosomal RNA small subunit methyltransferase G n=1 Tax=Spiroplasma taiwanense CT-1 TaxID=1276220 RepID=S5MIC8_9MOLU|nr:16S rRNA (guanine(527)-N(7))-methyltransferase RsmG [Spiroplasma taiwanense]AGR41660.1 16S rRNA methyltransferase GidB [Spiroplasma taiwanense CT-1]